MPTDFFKTLLILCAGISLAAPAAAGEPGDNWPHWRGPLANGTAPNADPPITWDAKTNIKWKTELPGRGSATPIVWGDQVFIVTAIKTDRLADDKDLPKIDPNLPVKTTPPRNYYQFVVMSFDRQTGKLRWKHTAAEKVPHEGHHAYAFLRRRVADHRWPFPVRLVRQLRHLLLRPGRQTPMAARPGPAQHPSGLGRSGHAGHPRRFAAAQLGSGKRLFADLSGREDGQDEMANRRATTRPRGTRRSWWNTRGKRR